jgi:hypothetical protein
MGQLVDPFPTGDISESVQPEVGADDLGRQPRQERLG